MSESKKVSLSSHAEYRCHFLDHRAEQGWIQLSKEYNKESKHTYVTFH